MAKDPARTDLYRLIAAGQQAHRALLAPLLERGLSAGDDAVLFLLAGEGAPVEALVELTGIDSAALALRLERLAIRGLVTPPAPGSNAPVYTLTDRGERIRADLEVNWKRTETALREGLGKKRRKLLGGVLDTAIGLLRR